MTSATSLHNCQFQNVIQLSAAFGLTSVQHLALWERRALRPNPGLKELAAVTATFIYFFLQNSDKTNSFKLRFTPALSLLVFFFFFSVVFFCCFFLTSLMSGLSWKVSSQKLGRSPKKQWICLFISPPYHIHGDKSFVQEEKTPLKSAQNPPHKSYVRLFLQQLFVALRLILNKPKLL